MSDKKKSTQQDIDAATDKYPGMAVNESDDEKVDAKLVKERTRTLNNNPRNNDL